MGTVVRFQPRLAAKSVSLELVYEGGLNFHCQPVVKQPQEALGVPKQELHKSVCAAPSFAKI